MTDVLADRIVQRLRDWGVSRVFGYAGDGIDPLLGALRRAGGEPEYVGARHEEMAAFMACGHAKFTGELGVCLATQGPGAIHLLAGLYDAKLDRRPVLAIVGQVVSTALGSGYQQEVDLHTLFRDVCGQYVQTVLSPQQLPMALDNAVRTALATSTPTCLIVPHDIQQAEAPEQTPHSHGFVPSAPVFTPPALRAPDDALTRAAAVLNDGARVALLVGAGAAGAADEIAAVVDVLGAGVTTSLLGKTVLDEAEPWHTGVMGHLGTTASAALMADCDTLLIVGCNDPWTEFYPPPGQARAVQIDVQPRVVGSKHPVEVPVIGDAREALAGLLPLLSRRADRGWQRQVEQSVGQWRDIADARAATEYRGANPQFVMGALSAQVPAGTRVAVDVGSSTYWYARHLRLAPGTPAHVSGYLAAMGCAMPYALAAKLAAPDRPVVALAGDGAMQMSGLLELITVADRWRGWADPRFAVLVLHNADLAEVSWEQREMEGDPRFAASQSVPSFRYADYAELLGLRAIRITRSADAAEAWRAAFAADRPMLIEALTDPAVPLLPPNLSKAKADKVIGAMSAEPDADRTHLVSMRHGLDPGRDGPAAG